MKPDVEDCWKNREKCLGSQQPGAVLGGPACWPRARAAGCATESGSRLPQSKEGFAFRSDGSFEGSKNFSILIRALAVPFAVGCLLVAFALRGEAAADHRAEPAGAVSQAHGEYERFSGEWESARVGRTVSYTVYSRLESSEDPLPVVVYVKNLGRERVGTEPDETIVQDFIDDDYIVVTLDYESDPAAVSPDVDWDLVEFRHAVAGHNTPSIFAGRPLQPHAYDIFVLPEGYRLARDLFFWDVARHGAHGTLQRVMNTYNGYVVNTFDVDPVESPDEMCGPNGEEIDYRLLLDIIYPSQPVEPVPLVFESATQSERMRGHRVAIDRAPYPIGFVTRGMAWAIADHCWNPLARDFHYGYWSQYSLDDWNGLRSGSAAARFFRFHADQFGIDRNRIGAMGHSKGAYAVTRLADPAHPTQSEFFTFSGQPAGSPEPQPWTWQLSRINVSYQSMGNGTRRTRYVTERNAPTVIACGRFDEFNHWDVFPDLVAAYEAEDLDHLALWMTDLGHTLARNHDDLLDADRYDLVLRYFERHLQVAGAAKPALLYSFPANGAKVEDLRGVVRMLPDESLLPDGKKDLLPGYGPIVLAFAPALDPDSVADGGVQLVRARDGMPVEGTWSLSHRNSRLSFQPAGLLGDYEDYRIEISPGVRAADGTTMGEPAEVNFRTGAISAGYAEWIEAHPEIPEEDRRSTADPFWTGIANLIAYAFDLDPLNPSRADIHEFTTHHSGDGTFLSLVFRPLRPELRYEVEGSNDLKTWQRDLPGIEHVDLPDGYLEVRAAPEEEHGRLFLRLAIEAEKE